jgi:hypothetical protein
MIQTAKHYAGELSDDISRSCSLGVGKPGVETNFAELDVRILDYQKKG